MAIISNSVAEDNRSKITVSSTEKQVKLKKDGTPKKSKCNKQSGISSEVDPLKKKEDIYAMLDEFDLAIRRADEDLHFDPFVARRNKYLFLIGINVGLRISDLISLKYSFFLEKDEDGFYFKDMERLKPQKTSKTGKYVDVHINPDVQRYLREFMSYHKPLKTEEDLDKYIFSHTESGKTHITSGDIWYMLDKTAKSAKLDLNIGTHSLRKTFGYHWYANSDDKSAALVQLQRIFRHTSGLTTMAYIGISQEDDAKGFSSLNLGF